MSITATRRPNRPQTGRRQLLHGATSVILTAAAARTAAQRRAKLRAAVTEGIRLEREILSDRADLSALANPNLSDKSTAFPSTDGADTVADTVRRRALGRVIHKAIGDTPTGAEPGWWIGFLPAILGDRPGLHMDARDAVFARLNRNAR